MIISLLVLVAALGFAYFLLQGSRMGYESAPYKVVRSEGPYEIRDYPALVVVETPMTGVGKESYGSFNRLFRFITGDNQAKQKIAMTTPVFISGEKEGDSTMAFVLPTKVQSAGAPQPTDGLVKVREFPAGRFAVMAFSGGRNEDTQRESLRKLVERVEKEGMRSEFPPVYAYFDPPWTPVFMRRNEVMVRVEVVKTPFP